MACLVGLTCSACPLSSLPSLTSFSSTFPISFATAIGASLMPLEYAKQDFGTYNLSRKNTFTPGTHMAYFLQMSSQMLSYRGGLPWLCYIKCLSISPTLLSPLTCLTFIYITCSWPLCIYLFMNYLLYQNTNSVKTETWSVLFSAISVALKQYSRCSKSICSMNRWMNASYFDCEYKDVI